MKEKLRSSFPVMTQKEAEEDTGRRKSRERARWFFKPQKTICKDNVGKSRSKKCKCGKKSSKPSWWNWKTTLLLPFSKWAAGKKEKSLPPKPKPKQMVQRWGALYLTESYYGDDYKSRSGVWRHGSSKSSLVVAEVGKIVEMPYFNLNNSSGYRLPTSSPAKAPAFPIYLVT